MIKSSLLCKYDNVVSGFSTLEDGNLGLHVGNNKEEVIHNRQRFLEKLNIDFKDIVCLNQTHSTNVEIVGLPQRGLGNDDYGRSIKNCDALITNVVGVPLFLNYADCTPIYLYDPVMKVIALIHSGIKGSFENITKETIDLMKMQFGTLEKDLVAYIGPNIKECCYELYGDYLNFAKKYYGDENILLENRINMSNLIRNQLIDKGVIRQKIEIYEGCTCCESQKFYSYRRDKEQAMRMAAVMMLR